MKTKLILGAGALAIAALAILAMTLVTTGIVNAQTPTNTTGTSTTPAAPTAPAAGSPVHLDGKVASVNAASIVVTTRSGDVTANISANTYIVVNKNGTAATGAITDLAAGEVVNVVGQATTDAKVVDAKLVTQGG
ncbi:MAG TPA: hypothetical protein VLQ48_03655, partial [Chloroflexia bacterium]|nr:hypothetical protein [Chloroflexia bacterium]